MKKSILFVASIFLMGNLAIAAEQIMNSEKSSSYYECNSQEPIVFLERGIEFNVFLNGQFDFNTRPTKSQTYYRNGRRNTVSMHYGGGNNHGVLIEKDNFGRIRRIGNVFMNYDNRNRIKRIGSVFMNYNSFGLDRIGGLRIVYNRRGQVIDFIGAVQGNVHGYNSGNHNQHNDDGYNGNNNQNDYYYKENDSKKESNQQTENTSKTRR